METIEIQIEPRELGGKGRTRRLRLEGKLPGIFYGPKVAPVALELSKREFLSRVAGLEGSRLIRMKSSSPLLANRVALVKEMQFDPVTGEVLHADFYEVDLAEKIRVKVPLHFVGKAEGVVRGGILQPIVREIEVECLPMEIPEYLDVDISPLDIGHSLHMTDLSMPERVEAVYETDFTLVTVVPPTAEEEARPVEAPAVGAEGAEVQPAAPEEKKKEEASEG